MKRKFWRKKLMAMTVLMSLLLSATGCSDFIHKKQWIRRQLGYLLVSVRKRSGK